MCFSLAFGIGQVPLITFPDLTSITFHEQTGSIAPFTYGVNDGALTTHLTGQLNTGNRDFEGLLGLEFYDVFYSDADGTFNINGGFVSIECRYDPTSGGGALNINEVEFHFGSGYSIYGSYLTSYVSNGSTYVPGSEAWAVDCNLATVSLMGNTENTTIRLRLTIGLINAASTILEETCSGSGFEVIAGSSTYNEANPMGMEVLTGNSGCDSLVFVDITFNEVYVQEINYTGCSEDGYSIVVGNTLYNETNPSGTETLMTEDNCDSTILVNLVFYPVYSTEVNYQGCEGDGYSVNVDGTVYNEANPDGTVLLIASNGCDSIIAINLSFAQVSYYEIDHIGCSGDNYAVVVNGTTYDEANPVGEEILLNQNGCDSIVNIELLFNPVQTTEENFTSCSGSGYAIVINGNIYSEGNPTGIEVMTNVEGCDSIIQIELTFLQATSQVINYSGCSGDGYSIMVNGTVYDQSNPVGQEVLTTVNGCDSIIVVSLSFLPMFIGNEFHSVCMGSGFSLLVNGTLYDENNPSGIEVLTSQVGCDSIVNIQLDFIASVMGAETYSGCLGDGYSVTVNSTNYNELNPSGMEILTSQYGCDSIVTINLIFQKIVSVTHSYTGCAGDGYAFVINGNLYNEGNPTGVEVIQGPMGCDTTVTIALVFQPIISTAINYVGCEGDGYEVLINGTLYNASNPQGSEIVTAQNGCDSIITISLNFLAGTQGAFQYSGCLGDNYSILINGTLYNELNPAGVEVLAASNGCDSIVTVNLVFGNQFISSFSYAGCEGDGYGIVVNGISYQEQNPNGVESMTNVLGCDSVITIAMSFAKVDTTIITHTGCIGDGYLVTINGSSYDEFNASGVEIMQSANGCDSIIQVDLIFKDCDEPDLECALFIPNVISPNEDGINDAFSFSYAESCEVTSLRVAIYDRWGQEVYSSTDPFFKWKCDFKGKQLQPGVFVYVAEIYFKDVSRPVIRRGDITLIW